jgi:hypothetical protein
MPVFQIRVFCAVATFRPCGLIRRSCSASDACPAGSRRTLRAAERSRLALATRTISRSGQASRIARAGGGHDLTA